MLVLFSVVMNVLLMGFVCVGVVKVVVLRMFVDVVSSCSVRV